MLDVLPNRALVSIILHTPADPEVSMGKQDIYDGHTPAYESSYEVHHCPYVLLGHMTV